MAENTVTFITEGRSLRALPFRPTEDQLTTGKAWEDWLESIEREFRYFRVANPLDRKDALIIYGGSEIARLEKSLPDPVDPYQELDDYQKLRSKLNAYFLPKKNKHYARYMFLKTRPEAGEATVAYATRLREKAHECEFGDNHDERMLEHLIQTIENQHLIQKCISKSWTLQQFLKEAGQIEDISTQVHDMKADSGYREIARVTSRRRIHTSIHPEYKERDGNAEYCTYCGLTRAHPRGRRCPAYGAQCNICKKFNHFSSVCRANTIQEETMDDDQKTPPQSKQKQKSSIRRAEEVYSNGGTSSDDDFIEKSLMHMRIKTVTEVNKASFKDIELLQGEVSRLVNELSLTKHLIQSILTQSQSEEHSLKETQEQLETCKEEIERTGLPYNMPDYSQREWRECQMVLTRNSASPDLDEFKENDEHEDQKELQTRQRKKRRKKKVPKKLQN